MTKEDNALQEVPTKKKGGCLRGCLVLVVLFFAFVLLVTACTSGDDNEGDQSKNNSVETKSKAESIDEEPAEAKPKELTPQEKMLQNITNLFDQKLAFDSGNYIQGDIPKGEYAFIRFDGSGQYYSEENQNGDIVDNENFDSFGYVFVHGVGNVTNRGLLVSTEAFENLGVTGAKELYEIINNKTEYLDSGFYKVGKDIPAGTYTLESYGEAYVAKLTGPVGNNDIIDNEIFNGKYQVNVTDGQYITISRAIIAQ